MRPSAPLFLVSSGHAHPTHEISSEAFEAGIPGITPGWSRKHLGMESRRILGPQERAVDLAIAATRDAMAEVGWEVGSIDLVVGGSVFPDQIVPASASYVANACSPLAVAFDLNAACSTSLFALATAAGLFAIDDGIERAAVCTADHPTAWVDYTDPHSCVFFGDAGSAMLLARTPGENGAFELLGVELEGDAEFPERVYTHRAGHFRSDGRFSFAQVMRLSGIVGGRLLADHGVTPGDLTAFAVHQASERVITTLAENVGVSIDRSWQNYRWAGNQSASGVVTAFSEGWHAARPTLRDGDLVLLAAVGGGYTAGAALLRWTI
jgi:3-oxoacyl-[acyl-carrier-protein] synthase-3